MPPLPAPETAGLVALAASDPNTLAALDDTTLLALLLQRGSPGLETHATARRLLAAFGGLAAVAAADLPELARVGRLTPAALTDLKLTRLMCERMARSACERRTLISSSSALHAYVRIALAELPREQFRVLFLDKRNQLLRDELIADGTVDHAPAYPREVVRRALELSASAMILVHNHPTGDPAPSQSDITTTRRIIDGARLFDIVVHDHLVVGRQGVSSLRSLGLI